jgi:PKD repeat protein
MKRVLLLLAPAVLLLAIVAGCNEEESKPVFTRLHVTPNCGVVPLDVEGYAILSGGNESGDPLGGNNNLEVQWQFGDGGTGSTSLAYHTYAVPGEYTVIVTGTDPDGNTTTTSTPIVALADSLVIDAGSSNFPDGNCSCVDTVRFIIAAESCDIDYPTVLGDSVKMEFKWDMGDMGGVDNTTYRVVAPEFRFREAGVYEVEAVVFYPGWAVERRQILTFNVATAPPAAMLSPESFDFGDTDVGTPVEGTLTISNDSCGDLIISAVSIDNAEFYTDLVPVTLAGNEETSVSVGFTASVEGAQTGTLTIESNDPESPVIRIPLAGAGIAP